MRKLTFSGHESFPCRQFWLKKGYDLVKQRKSFNDEAIVELGVGRNMVSAVKHWLRAFNILSEDEKLTKIANKIFANNGWDPFLEDEGTLWLLHYLFVANGYASIGEIIFNELRKERPKFTQEHFINYVLREKGNYNENTLKRDFMAFKGSYLSNNTKDLEENYTGILIELNLLTETKKDKETFYHIPTQDRANIPAEIILTCILMNDEYGDSISFDSLFTGHNSIGMVFALTEDGLFTKLNEIADKNAKIIYSDSAGIRELQFKGKKPDYLTILSRYYGK